MYAIEHETKGWRHRLVSVLVVALALFAASAVANDAAAHQDEPRTAHRLVISSQRDGNLDLWAIDDDGGNPTRLTNDPLDDMQPAVSSDGGRIAFARGVAFDSVPPTADLWIMDADGTEQRLLVAGLEVSDDGVSGHAQYRPSFSPDGSAVLFTQHSDVVGAAQSLWVVPTDGSGPARALVTNATYGNWGPDGRIAFVDDPLGAPRLAVADADGSNRHVITTSDGVSPYWSPDGRQIVFTSFRNGRGQLFVITADGSGERQLEDDDIPRTAGFATWSPDGARIAFSTTRNTDCAASDVRDCPRRIYTIAPDGTDLRSLPTDSDADQYPAFLPTPRSEQPASSPQPFAPTPKSEARYDIPEFPDPVPVPVEVPSGAGEMYVEIYRPLRDGIPVANTPVVLVVSPYLGARPISEQGEGEKFASYLDAFVPYGYAVALAHSYGTGNSTGCRDLLGPDETAAAAGVVRWLGQQTWSNGRVAMVGRSYDGAIALAVAARGDATPHLSAVVAEAITSWYDVFAHDGVSFLGSAAVNIGAHTAISTAPATTPSDGTAAAVLPGASDACHAENLSVAATFEPDAHYSPWFAVRSARPTAPDITTPLLMIHAFHDFTWPGPGPLGFFDRMAESTPHKLVLGQWAHAASHTTRADRADLLRAWLDRYLLGLDTGVESWPNVQVQDTNGNWRAEQAWPPNDAALGQLPLRPAVPPGGTLTDSTTYAEDTEQAVLTTGELGGPLHLTGQPVLDLWVTLDQPDQPDAHIVAELRAFDADGQPLTVPAAQGAEPPPWYPILAWRSMQHRDAIQGGEFVQAEGSPAPVGQAFRVPIRLYQSIDVVVPAGGRLDVVFGMRQPPQLPPADATTPSGSHTNITIHHSCAFASALRFQMPSKHSQALDVVGSLVESEQPASYRSVDGGGVATQRICGAKPTDPRILIAGG